MYLKDMSNGDLVEITDLGALFDPFEASVTGRYHAGEEMQDAQSFAKQGLLFPSGEALPRCWVDANYKQ
ncbi:acetyltransferase [Thiohalophilus sp.]|uniref:acetyltransferase n=1 Tax=Thiohalophilus sp. TaxID=3028392 RepID=UPI00397549E4